MLLFTVPSSTILIRISVIFGVLLLPARISDVQRETPIVEFAETGGQWSAEFSPEGVRCYEIRVLASYHYDAGEWGAKERVMHVETAISSGGILWKKLRSRLGSAGGRFGFGERHARWFSLPKFCAGMDHKLQIVATRVDQSEYYRTERFSLVLLPKQSFFKICTSIFMFVLALASLLEACFGKGMVRRVFMFSGFVVLISALTKYCLG